MIPQRLVTYLHRHDVPYVLLPHHPSRTSAETAHAMHVPAHRLVKSVLLEDESGVMMVVLSSDHQVSLREAGRLLGRRAVRLSDENRIAAVFEDCVRGAVPPVGMAWGVPTLVDDDLGRDDGDLFLEAGDHQCVLRLRAEAFRALMREAQHGHVAKAAREDGALTH